MTQPPGQPGGQGPDWGDMGRKLQQAKGPDRLILIGGVLFLIDSFLPWYGAGFGGVNIGGVEVPGFSVSIKGWSAGGLAVLAILFAIAAAIFAGINVAGAGINLGNVNPGLVYLVLGGGAFVFTLLRFVTATSGTKYGLYIALILGAVLAYGGWQKFQSAK